ncbi:MAG: HAD-IA family hydrolase [Pseudomonadota bacterium]
MPISRRCGVLFDLDGTLADTAQDLAYALNQTLLAWDRPVMPFERIRPRVSHGGRALIDLGFGLGPGDADYDAIRHDLLACYQANLARHTRLFPGMTALLEALDQRGIVWGIVTNKPAWLTDPLMQALPMPRAPDCVVSGDTTLHAKPHPEPIFYACRQLGILPADCWVVGDAERDIQAGLAAGTRTLVALFGYLDEQDQPDCWGADGGIKTPGELLDWLDRG